MKLLLMSAELLGGMFSYIEAKHMLAISLCVRGGVCVWCVRQGYASGPCQNVQSPLHLVVQSPQASTEGLLFKAKVTSSSHYSRETVASLEDLILLRDKTLTGLPGFESCPCSHASCVILGKLLNFSEPISASVRWR